MGESTELIALGVRIPVTVPTTDAEVATALFAPWRDLEQSAAIETASAVRLDQVTAENLDERAAMLAATVTLAALEQLRGRELLLHAAGIADERGRVAAFVGPSGRGKTTASMSLARRYGYVSDEAVSVAASGAVRSYRKPLSVKLNGRDHKRQIAPSDLDLRPLPDAPLRLGAVVLLDRDPHALQPGPIVQPVPLCQAIAELVPQISYLPHLPEPLAFIARLLDRIGPVRRVVYAEAASLPEIVPLLFSSGAEPASWRQVLPVPAAKGDRVRYRAAATLDAIESSGRTAVLLANGTLHLIEGTGPSLWRAVCAGNDTAAIIDAVGHEHGQPPEGPLESAVAARLAELTRAGLLTDSATDAVGVPL